MAAQRTCLHMWICQSFYQTAQGTACFSSLSNQTDMHIYHKLASVLCIWITMINRNIIWILHSERGLLAFTYFHSHSVLPTFSWRGWGYQYRLQLWCRERALWPVSLELCFNHWVNLRSQEFRSSFFKVEFIIIQYTTLLHFDIYSWFYLQNISRKT